MFNVDNLKYKIDNILSESGRNKGGLNPVEVEPAQKKFRLNYIKQLTNMVINIEDYFGFAVKQLNDIANNHTNKIIRADALDVLSALESFKRSRKNLSIKLMSLLMKIGKV